MEIYVDDEAKLTLHGLKQHYVKLAVFFFASVPIVDLLQDNEKNRKLFDLLDVLEFNQVNTIQRPDELA